MSNEITIVDPLPRFSSIEEQVAYEVALERIAAVAARGWTLRFWYGCRGFRFVGKSSTGHKVIGAPAWDKRAALSSVLNGIEDEWLLTP